jgi:hypothetical protein
MEREAGYGKKKRARAKFSGGSRACEWSVGNLRHLRQRLPRPLRAILPILLSSLALVLIVAGVSSAAPPRQTPPPFNQAIADAISQVTTPTLAYELAGLTGERPVTVAGSLYTITTRNSFQSEAISMATRYAYEQLADLGLAVTYHPYGYSGYQWRNVVAEKHGLVSPDEITLLTAHVDSLPSGPIAPGADDNGSGSVAVLMAARLLAPRYLARTVRFVLFTGEEQGLRGSAAYAADSKARGEQIKGVVNLDMTAYNSDEDPIIDLYAHTSVPASLALTRLFSEVIGVYGLNLTPYRYSDEWPINASDQWSFLQKGYPAFLAIEDMGDFTPHYHTVSDTLSTLDLDYYADTTRAAIATIAHLGQVLPSGDLGQLSGTVHELDTGHPLSGATVVALWPAYQYTFTSTTGANGVYSSSLPVGSYTLTVQGPAAGYYQATITDVLIVTNTITTRDAALAPWPRWYLPLIMRGS